MNRHADAEARLLGALAIFSSLSVLAEGPQLQVYSATPITAGTRAMTVGRSVTEGAEFANFGFAIGADGNTSLKRLNNGVEAVGPGKDFEFLANTTFTGGRFLGWGGTDSLNTTSYAATDELTDLNFGYDPLYDRMFVSGKLKNTGTCYGTSSCTIVFGTGNDASTARGSVVASLPSASNTFMITAANASGFFTNTSVGVVSAGGLVVGARSDATVTPYGIGAFTVTADWGTGFNGQIVVTNQGPPTSNWKIEFDLNRTIGFAWNGTVISAVSGHYVIHDAGFNGALNTGTSTSVGFQASPGGSGISFSNFVFSPR